MYVRKPKFSQDICDPVFDPMIGTFEDSKDERLEALKKRKTIIRKINDRSAVLPPNLPGKKGLQQVERQTEEKKENKPILSIVAPVPLTVDVRERESSKDRYNDTINLTYNTPLEDFSKVETLDFPPFSSQFSTIKKEILSTKNRDSMECFIDELYGIPGAEGVDQNTKRVPFKDMSAYIHTFIDQTKFSDPVIKDNRSKCISISEEKDDRYELKVDSRTITFRKSTNNTIPSNEAHSGDQHASQKHPDIINIDSNTREATEKEEVVEVPIQKKIEGHVKRKRSVKPADIQDEINTNKVMKKFPTDIPNDLDKYNIIRFYSRRENGHLS